MEDTITVGVLTVSDSCSIGKAEDRSGNNLVEIINNGSAGCRNVSVVARDCIPDDCKKIKEVLIEWCDVKKLNVIFTTGGTGFGHRDVTPEATRLVIEKEAPGLSTAMLIDSLKSTQFAMLSRAVCGIRKNTIIINLPGSTKGSEECLNAVLMCIPHAVSVVRNKTENIKKEHSVIQGTCDSYGNPSKCNPLIIIGDSNSTSGDSCPTSRDFNPPSGDSSPDAGRHHGDEGKSKVDISRVARRQREQALFPMIALDDAVKIVVEQALRRETEKIDLRVGESRFNIIGCVLAENVVAVEPFPPFPASVKDGYAVVASSGTGVKKVVGDRLAGSSPNLHPKGENICVRVNTGAPIPLGMDAVVQVEDTELVEEADDGRVEVSVNILTKPVAGQDIRQIGSDIAKGQLILEESTVISSTELGLLATLGINEVKIYKRPIIGILSTGDELNDPWTEDNPKPGCIRDSNKITLIQLLKENGFIAVDCGIAKDNPDDVLEMMSQALEKVDVLITSGSVSMGEKDVIKSVLKTDLGAEIHFGRVKIKPGKPMTFATLRGVDGRTKLVFALPGNPSSAVVTSHVFVLPALRRLAGKKNFLNEVVVVKVNEKIKLDSRPELMRALLSLVPKSKDKHQLIESVFSIPDSSCGDYDIVASTTGNQMSSRLASLQGANGLLCLPSCTSELKFIEAGSCVHAYVIGKLIC